MLYDLVVSFAGGASELLTPAITLRTALAALVSFALSLWAGPRFIRYMQRRGYLERAADSDSADISKFITTHAQQKLKTPTMGGVPIVGTFLVSAALFSSWSNLYALLGIFVVLSFAVLGWLDDATKMAGRGGLSRRAKMLGLTGAGAVVLALTTWFALSTGRDALLTLHLPVVKDASINCAEAGILALGLLLFFEWFVLVGSANAVNITDGLDGLASGCALISVFAVSVFCYAAGHYRFAEYLNVPFVKDAGEVTVLGGALLGSILGFLWFNATPAQIFMGDTGSLAIGGFLGYAAIIARQELILPVVALVFVIEAASSWIQIYSYKLTKKRPFPYAPIHHIWQKRGMPESKLVVRFWIVAAVSAVAGLALLKLP
ncbi:MAG: phospho-N-acetylmuramoyl-pentapeptide-transferase [Planctomycetes bacterium]|nr:phospho-N-acetylmuramoyl-pentapeptide-transferase [Planctomycetota bacterium]